VFWTSYLSIDGSTIAPGWSPIGSECADEMGYALGELHAAIQAGLDRNVTWVDVEDIPWQRRCGPAGRTRTTKDIGR
jgi:hypothetical protein